VDEHLILWLIDLAARGKSPRTKDTYQMAVEMYLRWCFQTGRPAELTKDQVRQYLAQLLQNGAAPATARIRYAALRQFAKWIANEEGTEDPLLGMTAPKLDSKVVDALTEDELRALIYACRGKDFRDRRDEAALRLMAECGLRAGEVIALTTGDVDISRGLVTVRRGKGGKGRIVAVGPSTALALGRWLRARREHRLAHTPALWLGGGGKSFGYHGLDHAMRVRAEMAGVKGFHLHKLRHTFATRWLNAGGSEQSLMTVAGWTTRSMIERYTGASAAERAADEARSLGLGEL
jgi:site-specific recombinase XerD